MSKDYGKALKIAADMSPDTIIIGDLKKEELDPDFMADTMARFRALDEAEQKQIVERIEKAGMFEQLKITATTNDIFNAEGWPYPGTVVGHLVSWAEAHYDELESYRDIVDLYFEPKPINPRW